MTAKQLPGAHAPDGALYVCSTNGVGTISTISGGGGGTGDASADNQEAQITQETLINTVLGTPSQAKSTATDTTAISHTQILKQISASVQSPPSQAVTNTGAFVVQENGTAGTSLALIDDTIAAQGTALGSVKTSLIGASVSTSAPTYTTGQINPLSLDTTGALRVTGAGGGTQYTEDVAAASDPVGNILMAVRRDTLSTSEVSADGDNIAIKATNKGQVHVRAEIDSTQLTTLNTAVKAMADNYQLVALPSDQVKIPVHGNTAHDSSDSDSPIKIGGQARTTNPTAVADADRVNFIADKLGKQIAVGAIRELKGVTQTSISNTTSETTIVAAVASTFCDVYGLIFANTGATTTKVTIKDATSGTTRMIFEVPTLETRGFMVPVDSAIPQSTVNNNWTATCASATTAMEVTAFWVKNT